MLSLMLMCISVIIGIIAISFTNKLLTVIYVAITIVSFGGVLYFYCLKCPSKDNCCGHVLPGKLAVLFPKRKSEKYSSFDILATLIALALIIVFPQYWLWKYKILFFVFWLIFAIATLEILLFVCKECKNEKCPMCPNPKRIT
jgi:hypothetical protein